MVQKYGECEVFESYETYARECSTHKRDFEECLKAQLRQAQEWREKAEELLKLCYENLDDDLEERPLRHSIGNIIGRIRALSALETGKEKQHE